MKKTTIPEMQRLTVDEFRRAEKMPLVVVLDDVRSLYNVGSIFRTADAFRVEAIYLCGITATPQAERRAMEIHKTALGAEFSVAWRYFPTATEAVEALKAQGCHVLAVEQAHGSTMLQDFMLNAECRMQDAESDNTQSMQSKANSALASPVGADLRFCIGFPRRRRPSVHNSALKKYAIVLGNEVKGVHQEVIDLCDGCLEIPQFGTKHSLNVSVTAGIVIWHFASTLKIRSAP